MVRRRVSVEAGPRGRSGDRRASLAAGLENPRVLMRGLSPLQQAGPSLYVKGPTLGSEDRRPDPKTCPGGASWGVRLGVGLGSL